MGIHKSITLKRAEAAARESMFGMFNPGFCHACGEDADGVEPDARNRECESCGEKQVFGAEETFMMVA